MSTREESFKRMRSETWANNGHFRKGLAAARAKVQSLSDGSGDCVYDEYAILVASMPSNSTPQTFLLEMASDLNGIVNDEGFNAVNFFRRSASGAPTVGEVIHIDIAGPDNGCVILAELKSDYFVFQTVKTESAGTHPENGSREFGFEQVGSKIKLYTRGVSRPGSIVIRYAGAVPQQIGWTRLCIGLGHTLAKRGGQPVPKSFVLFKQNRKY